MNEEKSWAMEEIEFGIFFNIFAGFKCKYQNYEKSRTNLILPTQQL